MRLALKLHPDSLCSAVTRIEVEIARPRAGDLVLSYRVTGKIGDLRLPPATAAARTDELWRHTCFEAFVRPSPGAAYYEFNFAPSTQWAAYRFDSYRSGMHVAAGIGAPRIEPQSAAECYTLQAALELSPAISSPAGGGGQLNQSSPAGGGGQLNQSSPASGGGQGGGLWRLGVAAVIEETSGRKSYWALAHPPGKPDFHHPDSFAHVLS
jgi:hypothetical protein